MTKLNQILKEQRGPIDLSQLIASISDEDLNLLISAGGKMQQGETVLTSQELDACVRWYPQLGIVQSRP